MEEEVEKRKRKIKKWFSDRHNLLFFLIILFAFAVRFYYFLHTLNQPLWWDEAEYMLKAKSLFIGTPSTGWASQREIVVPIIWGILYSIIHSEFLPRLLQVFVSLATVVLTYFFGEKLFDKKTGLIAAFIISVNAVHLFFTERLLTYLWAPTFFLLFFYFFWKGYVDKQGNKYFYLSAIIAAIGISIYGSLAFAVLVVLLFLLITEQHKIFFKKEIWIAAVLGFIFLIPQFLYNYYSYGSIASRWAAFAKTAGNQMHHPEQILAYFKMFPHFFSGVFTILIIVGALVSLFLISISFDFILKNKDKKIKSHLFIFLWALVVLAFYTYAAYSGESVYDAFIMPAFPALALIAANGIMLLYKFPLDKKIINFIIIIILILGGFFQLSYAGSLINNKITSFEPVKDAGLWIKARSTPDAVILSQSRPQMTYYSERKTYAFANSSENLFNQIKEIKPSYFVDSIFEPVGNYVHTFPKEHPGALTPVNAYFLDVQKTQPSLIIYSVDSFKLNETNSSGFN